MINSASPSNPTLPNKQSTFKVFFFIGMQEYYISANGIGYASWPDRYSAAAANLDKYLINPNNGLGVNERIGFASFANSQEEFLAYMMLLFNLKFTSTPKTSKDRL